MKDAQLWSSQFSTPIRELLFNPDMIIFTDLHHKRGFALVAEGT